MRQRSTVQEQLADAVATLRDVFSFSPIRPMPTIMQRRNLFGYRGFYHPKQNYISIHPKANGRHTIFEEAGHYLHFSQFTLEEIAQSQKNTTQRVWSSIAAEAIGYVCSKVGDPTREERWQHLLENTQQGEKAVEEIRADRPESDNLMHRAMHGVLVWLAGKALSQQQHTIARTYEVYDALAQAVHASTQPHIINPPLPYSITRRWAAQHRIDISHIVGYDLGEALWQMRERGVAQGTSVINRMIATPPQASFDALLTAYRSLRTHGIESGLDLPRPGMTEILATTPPAAS